LEEAMLLRHTPAEPAIERQALTINPAKTCQPIGAMYAALGLHGCMPHSHGSQGCCSYHRSALTRHYKEPIIAGSSSFTEGSSVFGGQANLLEAITNLFSIYDAEVVAVHTTCLSETIGDDITQIVAKAQDEGRIPKGKYVIKASTPSYVGSHVTGYSNMVKGMIEVFAKSTGKKLDQVNIIPGFVEPSDMAEIKRMANEMGVKTVLFPDTSSVLNSPQSGKYSMYPKGGATVAEVASSGDSSMTLALGPLGAGPGARLLDTQCKVPCQVLDLPLGLRATDIFIDALRKAAGAVVPESIMDERGQVLDFITDMQQYFHGKSAALAGDPDQLVPLAQFLTDIGMQVKYAVTGTPGKKFESKMQAICGPAAKVKEGGQGDLYQLHQWIKQDKVDMIFGGTYCKYIGRDEDIPVIRFGFPIYDRVGHQYFPILGYRGALRLLEKVLTAIQDRQDRDAPEEKFELVM
jgi:nitrogenase molybdenum-iron protein beta chain